MIVSLLSRNSRCVSYLKKKKILPQASYPDEHEKYQLKWAVVTNFIKILTVGTAIKLSET